MNIALITGGQSGERVVSIASAQNVKEIIDFGTVEVFTFPEDTETFIQRYKEFDLAIPVIHGIGGEDGSLQGFLETLGMPYLFSGVTTHAIAINKRLTKQIVKQLGITVAKEITIENLQFPLFAKPNNGGSSVASKLCISKEELDQLTNNHREIDFIFEEPIRGREFTVGVIDHNHETISLPVVEIIPKGAFFDYDSKYDADKLATEVCPAEIDTDLKQNLQTIALTIHKSLDVKHLSCSDFIVTSDNAIYFLEINTIPGMTNTSIVPKMIKVAGYSLKDLFQEWTAQVKQ